MGKRRGVYEIRAGHLRDAGWVDDPYALMLVKPGAGVGICHTTIANMSEERWAKWCREEVEAQ